ncbi:MAG: hypothetical protein D6785_09145 [Planctomycetota bacterium]|nr:MAG: hypothetical protein D6785_09145 [Planctomycetota bacterium]
MKHFSPRNLKAKGTEILEGEEGQSMVLAALTMLVLAMFIVLSYNISDVASRKIQVQNAADAAAYSGALIEANSLNTIAWLNDGMTFIYYNLLRYSIDRVVFQTLAKFKGRNPSAPDNVIGTANIQKKAQDAEQIYQNWVPKGVRWLRHIKQLEDIIVKSTPSLIKKEVIEVALANGADAVALLPDKSSGSSPLPTMEDYLEPESWYLSTSDKKYWLHRMEKKYGELPLIRDTDSVGGTYYLKHLKLGASEWVYSSYGNGSAPGIQAYYQIRTCWNQKDLNHQQGHSGSWDFFSGNPADQGPPSGHWHVAHQHILRIIYTSFGPIYIYYPSFAPPSFHKNGHEEGHVTVSEETKQYVFLFPLSMETARNNKDGFFSLPDSMPLPPWPYKDLAPYHHAIQICPTCVNLDHDYAISTFVPNAPVRSGEIGKSDFAYWYSGSFSDLRNLPAPYVLNGSFSTSGIVVMTWQKPSKTTLLKKIFSNPPQGIFAIAHAKVGVWKTEKHLHGKEVFTRGNLVSEAFSQQLTEPIEFGARLAPLNQISNLQQVLSYFQNNASWYDSPNSFSGGNSDVGEHLKKLGPQKSIPLTQLWDRKYWQH